MMAIVVTNSNKSGSLLIKCDKTRHEKYHVQLEILQLIYELPRNTLKILWTAIKI